MLYRNEIDRVAFAAGLKRLMEREKVTVFMLAEWIETSRQTIAAWRSGRALPRRHFMTKLEKIFRMRVDEIVRIGKETEKNG